MLVTEGGRFGGYGFYLLKGKAVFLWNLVERKRDRWEAPEVLSSGKHTLVFDFYYEGVALGSLASGISGIGKGGLGVCEVVGKEVASKKMEHAVRVNID